MAIELSDGMQDRKSGMRNSGIRLCTLFLMLLSSVVFSNEVVAEGETQSGLSFAKNELDKWVEAKTLISSEKRSWNEEKAFSEQLLGVLSEEKKALHENLEATKSALSSGDHERMALLADIEKFKATQAALGNEIDRITKKLLLIREQLPKAFKEDLAKNYAQLAMYSGEGAMTQGKIESAVMLAIKLQNIDNSFFSRTQVIEVEVGGERLEREVEVLYAGLWRAYYVDPYGRFSGVGFASEQGWVWQEDNAIVREVKQALKIFEGEVAPTLIRLPVIAREG